MTKGTKKGKLGENVIAVNRKARHDFTIEETFEAGLALEGWEVKALRAGRAQIQEAYILVHHGEAFLLGGLINPLPTASTHIVADPQRTRKLLLHKDELSKLVAATEQKGYTVVPLQLYWKRGKAKLQIGMAKGKKKHDKRADIKERDWERERARLLKEKNR